MTRTRQVSAITAGFIPLIDSAVLLAAAKQGFAAAENIELQLVRETSWANIRDKIAVGHLDVAHMLAPMPIANNLGLTPLPTQMIAPMALGTGGNVIALSSGLWADVMRHGARNLVFRISTNTSCNLFIHDGFLSLSLSLPLSLMHVPVPRPAT